MYFVYSVFRASLTHVANSNLSVMQKMDNSRIGNSRVPSKRCWRLAECDARLLVHLVTLNGPNRFCTHPLKAPTQNMNSSNDQQLPGNALTEEEATRYDRQMRLWGIEAQQR